MERGSLVERFVSDPGWGWSLARGVMIFGPALVVVMVALSLS